MSAFTSVPWKQNALIFPCKTTKQKYYIVWTEILLPIFLITYHFILNVFCSLCSSALLFSFQFIPAPPLIPFANSHLEGFAYTSCNISVFPSVFAHFVQLGVVSLCHGLQYLLLLCSAKATELIQLNCLTFECE